GANGEVYALAQGNLVVGGLGVSGQDGSRLTVNVPSVGRIPNGATVERAVPSDFASSETLLLNLNTPDFTTVHRLVQSINSTVGTGSAVAMDAASVRVIAPADLSQRIAFMSMLENMQIEPGEAPARVVVNSRSGTVVIGSHVRVTPAAVAHGSLTVTIAERPFVSQPNAFGEGETVVVPRTQIEATQEGSRMFLLDSGTTLDEIVRAINDVGASPADLVAILEALKQAGALRAELIII
ncbi:MAG: flagellar basal body P-ring protein FlgI, partial [Gammaproteobacteria bacterium]|nr:flagellar basal body P-ring protein FlgI [Gammaproteobacteria bacterium]